MNTAKLKTDIILLLVILIGMTFVSCKEDPKKVIEQETLIDEEVKEKPKKLPSKYSKINNKSTLDKNYVDCIPEGYSVTEMKTHKNHTAGDYNADGIFEIAAIIRKNNIVKLIVVERDTLGKCSKQYMSGNLTPRLLNQDQMWQIYNSTTTRFRGPKETSSILKFEFRSDNYVIELDFYGDKNTHEYYLLKSLYISYENTKKKESYRIVKDYLKKERIKLINVEPKRTRITDTLPDKTYPISTLDYTTIMQLIKA